MTWVYNNTNELYHHGVKGQKWGVRRYQNPDGTLTKAGKKKYLKDMYKDMSSHFEKQISEEARKVTTLGRNGYADAGMDWSSAYRKGKVTSKDAQQVRKAAKNTRDYAVAKYGKSAVDALAKSGVWGRPISDFIIKESDKE